MKRLTLVISVITLGAVLAFSQNSERTKTMEEVKQYIDDNVFPLIEKQQTKYLSKLSEAEKTELSTIKNSTSERRGYKSGKPGNCAGNNYTKNNSNFENRPIIEVEKITNSHPKLNNTYKKVIIKNKQKWIDDISAIHKKYGTEPMHSKDGKIGIEMFFTRVENPNWLLLWDSSNPRMFNGNYMRNQKNKKRNNYSKATTNLPPELKAEIKLYTSENIIPVIAKERLEFDEILSNDEKKAIDDARQKIEVRKIMFKNWYESSDFEAGKRAKDPNFDAMRTDMQKSMAEVREIALTHSVEISESTAIIRNNAREWNEEISAISEKYNQDPDEVKRMMRSKIRKSQTPVSFLLFNPNKSEEADLFGFEKEDEMKVIVYPNPVYENATIAVLNSAGKNVKVTLYTIDGEVAATLYNDKNTKQRLEIMLDVTGLDNDMYIVKVSTGATEISRKIVVK